MAFQKRYLRAPIVEAVLDIQLNGVGVTLDMLERCGKKVRSDYPTKKALHFSTGQINLGPKSSASTTSEPIGYAWTSIDESRIFQARASGFSFSKLAPYTGWHDFNTEARRLWNFYRKTIDSHQRFTRVALRYINKLDFPVNRMVMKDYFNIYPLIPDLLPQDMSSFFFQLTLPLLEAKSTVNIAMTAVPPPAGKEDAVTSILFDIDVYRTESIPMGEAFWGVFEVLAAQKNHVFEECITQKTRDLIEEEK